MDTIANLGSLDFTGLGGAERGHFKFLLGSSRKKKKRVINIHPGAFNLKFN